MKYRSGDNEDNSSYAKMRTYFTIRRRIQDCEGRPALFESETLNGGVIYCVVPFLSQYEACTPVQGYYSYWRRLAHSDICVAIKQKKGKLKFNCGPESGHGACRLYVA